jgi:hypothetical protein
LGIFIAGASGQLKRADNIKIDQSRPNLTWEKSVKKSEELDITKELAMDLLVLLTLSFFSN